MGAGVMSEGLVSQTTEGQTPQLLRELGQAYVVLLGQGAQHPETLITYIFCSLF